MWARTCRDSSDRLVQLEFVQDGLRTRQPDSSPRQRQQLTRLSRRVQPEHQQPHLLVSKNLPCKSAYSTSAVHVTRPA